MNEMVISIIEYILAFSYFKIFEYYIIFIYCMFHK